MGAEEAEVAVPSLSLRDFILVLRRRKSIALITFAAVLGLVVISTLLSKAQYSSVASLMLEDNAPQSSIGDLSPIFAPQAGMAVDSQVQLLNSPLILDKVYQQSGVEPGSVNLTVTRVEKTSQINIVGVSTSREGVEKFVAALPGVYQNNRRTESAREVTSELNFSIKGLAQESKKLDDTESAIANFKTRNGLVDPGAEATNALGRATQAKSDLAAARTDISSLRAQIAALEENLATLPPSVNAPVTATNPLVQELKNQLAGLKSKRKELLFLYKPADDNIRQIDLQIATLQARITRTSPTITSNSLSTNPAVADARGRIEGLRADLSARQAAAGVLADQSAKLNGALGRFTDIQRQQAQLQREFDANQAAVKDGKEKVRQLSVRAKALQEEGAPITVTQPGTPAVKIAPKPSRNIVLGIFLGALLACAAALLQDSLDDRVRDEDEARQLLGAPVLGYFPLLPVSDERQILDMNHPDPLLLETFRALRSNVQFALVNSAGKKLQITSTVPNEGKSYIASNLAITMALDGRRVILVDADLHRPTMHERFGIARQPGLTNILVGQATIEDSLQDVGVQGLRVISAGALPPNPAELLNSPTMLDVMAELEKHADLIIFDTPPLLATSDSQLMSAKMDGVVFVMQMGSVARSGTLRAFELLKQAHANLIGIVFNKVDAGKNSVYYQGYSSYYALDPDASAGDVLVANPTNKSAKTLSAGEQLASNPGANSGNGHSKNGESNGAHRNGNGAQSKGVQKNGSQSDNAQSNGTQSNGSPGQTTVFDEAINPDKNHR